MNHVNLGGNLCADPEVKKLKDDKSVTVIRLAVNKRYKKNGETVTETLYIDCEAFGTTGETIAKFFKKGDGIYVGGELRQDNWKDDQGNPRSKMKLVLNNFNFPVGGGNRQETQESEEVAAAPAPAAKGKPARKGASNGGGFGDDIGSNPAF